MSWFLLILGDFSDKNLDFQMHAISRLLGVRWCRWTFIKVEIAVFRFLLVSSRQMNCKLGQFSMAWKNSEIASGNTLILMCYQIQKSTCRILKKCPDKKYFSDFQLSLYSTKMFNNVNSLINTQYSKINIVSINYLYKLKKLIFNFDKVIE